ncbi:site-specific integrase [Agreia pratensis]|uniref:site-specific integrase n=1 Tax=Agreia pratensis TaxID=150121 RepID=UPI001E2A28AC|nr:site-specific integrase [Agreia pratensis]
MSSVTCIRDASIANKDSLIRLLAYTGLRWGEAIGIRVGKVDFLRRRVQIDENAVRVGGRIVTGTPKTHERRSVPFPTFLADSLSADSLGKSRDDLIFGSGEIHLQTPSSRDGWYEKAIRSAQAIDPDFPRVTIHDLRHTAASLAISSGANVKAVQRMLGHKSAAMTLDTYADLFDDDLDAVATALGDARTRANVGKMWAIPDKARSSRQPDPRQMGDVR